MVVLGAEVEVAAAVVEDEEEAMAATVASTAIDNPTDLDGTKHSARSEHDITSAYRHKHYNSSTTCHHRYLMYKSSLRSSFHPTFGTVF